jgi:hypothetical protein
MMSLSSLKVQAVSLEWGARKSGVLLVECNVGAQRPMRHKRSRTRDEHQRIFPHLPALIGQSGWPGVIQSPFSPPCLEGIAKWQASVQ